MKFNSVVERNKFVENNLGLVVKRMKIINNGRYDDDLYQIASVALIEAIDRFDEDKGVKFSTYAVKYIDGYILKYKRYNSLIKPLREKNSSKFYYKDITSLDSIAGESFTNSLCDNIDVERNVIDNISVSIFLSSLSERDRLIINLAMNGVKQSKISKIVGVSQQQVSRIINRGVKNYKRHYS